MALSVDIHKKVSGFSLDVAFEEDGEVLALLGASGCGKSMTLMCIAGIVKPDSGRIVLNGRILYDSAHHINVPPPEAAHRVPVPAVCPLSAHDGAGKRHSRRPHREQEREA